MLEIFNFCTPFREPRVSAKQWEMKMLMHILNQQRQQLEEKNFNLICLANHFHRTTKHCRWNCLYYRRFKKDDTKQRKYLRFMKFNNFLFSSVVDFFRCFFLKKFHFHYWRKEKRNIWIKSFRGRAPDGNLHTDGISLNHNCAFQLHHVTKLLNVSLFHPKILRNCHFFSTTKKFKIKEISSLKLFKMMTVFSWSCFALKKSIK